MTFSQWVYTLIHMSLRDLVNNIKWAKLGLALDVVDPWKRREVEAELDMRKINYIQSYCEGDGHYLYAILGGDRDKLNDFVKWFKTDKDWKYYITKHTLFKTDMTYLCR